MSNKPQREIWFNDFRKLKKFLSISSIIFTFFNLFGICQQNIFGGLRGAIISGVAFHLNMLWLAPYIMNYVYLRMRGLIDKQTRLLFGGAIPLFVSIILNLILRILFL